MISTSNWTVIAPTLAVLALHLWMVDLLATALLASKTHPIRPATAWSMLGEALLLTLVASTLLLAHQPTLGATGGAFVILVSPWYLAALFCVKAAISWISLCLRYRREENAKLTGKSGPWISILSRGVAAVLGIWIVTQAPLVFVFLAPPYLILLTIDMALTGLMARPNERTIVTLPIETTCLFVTIIVLALAIAQSWEIPGLVGLIIVAKLAISLAADFFPLHREQSADRFRSIRFWLTILLRCSATGAASAWMISRGGAW